MAKTHPDQIGRYAILERLAVGGMAIVYLAFEQGDTGLQRLVVIKQILPQHGQDHVFRNMFVQEARLAAGINHPNVVEIHELGEFDDEPFIAMEYVAGVPLNELLRNARDQQITIPAGVALDIVQQACAGAHAAHELRDPSGEPANLVHRDLTPHNLIVTESGLVKVLDFGVAKARTNPEQTQTGMLKGKLPYMSPEQLWQAELDRRSDVFTLGAVLWEMLLGRRLYGRDTEVATVNAVLSEGIPSLGSVRDDIPAQLQGVAMEALSKKADERPETAQIFRRSLVNTARQCGIEIDQDHTAEFVQGLMANQLQTRREEVDARVEQSLYSLAEAQTATTHTPEIASLSSAPTSPTATTHPSERSSPGSPLHRPAGKVPVQKRPETWTGMAIGAVGTAGFMALCIIALIWTDVLRTPTSTTTSPPPAPVAGDVIRILMAPTVDPEILKGELEPLRAYLQRYLARPVEWTIAQTYGETSDRLLADEVAFASLPPNLYIRTHQANPAVRLVAVKIHAGSHGSDGVLLVRGTEEVTQVEDMRGKVICYTDPDSTTGYILPRALLRTHGIDPDRDMEKAVVSGNHLQLMRDLLDERCDVGGTFTAAYATGDAAGLNTAKMRVLAITGRTPHDAICAAPGTSKALEAKMRKALLDFDPQRDAGVQHLGEIERLSGFSSVADAVYDPLRAALAAERAALDAGPAPSP